MINKIASILLSIGILCVISCQSKQPDQVDSLNVIVILADDQGWGDLGFTGNSNVRTPHLDKLAESGITFDNFYVSPVCSPTRAEFLTGRYYPRGGVYSTSAGGERLDLDEKTIAEYFKEAGYKTAAYGKWHNGMQYPYHPNARGFDDFYGFCSGHWGNYFSPMLEHNGEVVQGNGYLPDDLTDHGISFIEKNADQPFLLYLPYNTPHSPMQVPDEWWNKMQNRALDNRADSIYNEDMEFTKAALAMTENIDYNVGRIVQKLEELELREETIIVYFSDNGPNSFRWNGRMKGRKGSTDEGGVRSPLIINWPGKTFQKRSIQQIASSIDLLPTIGGLAHIKIENPKPLDGRSLVPILENESADWPDRLVYSHWQDRVSVRSQKYRLDNKGNLYDIEKDRGQKINLSADLKDVRNALAEAQRKYVENVIGELPAEDLRTFPVGHSDTRFTQLPARDGRGTGGITRSNRYPNCSFYTNWMSTKDSIIWDIEVVEKGDFRAFLYYTAQKAGAEIKLSFHNNHVSKSIEKPHNPPLNGMENDRIPRGESYVKDFIPMDMGDIVLEKGIGVISLSSNNIPVNAAADIRMLLLERIE